MAAADGRGAADQWRGTVGGPREGQQPHLPGVEEKRARAEETLARARQEPDSRRQTAEREQETASVRDSAGPAQDGEGIEETGVPLVDALAAGGVMFREQLRRLGMVTGRRDGRGTAPRIVDGEGAEKSDPVGERTFTPPTCDRPDPDPAP
ncbi:hypothetical protein AMK33_34810 [Streptomyces sp. CB02400]|nr:hypothetical protein AMK33_34810 [Streptomyces sp. CB02400]